jgi:hypothetical protein
MDKFNGALVGTCQFTMLSYDFEGRSKTADNLGKVLIKSGVSTRSKLPRTALDNADISYLCLTF